ncbi:MULTISPECIES: Lrp/AsnC family transcriptional regulator [Bordetella]|uniref:AsnC family transcriptional regulator n=1 Tax=Bordetella genomosp. 7 TaxID=1416805 RepID=A0A261RCZ1_9BORD|nr:MULTISPECIES: Lrp/AsnC family transcriptional regulator [Bordetella]OZI22879.1 AsnC family transcriptional regulator [Bordetella genomosp. 7]
MTLDNLDVRILAQLQRDADLSNAALAARVGLSPSACLRRVARLKKQGIIRRIVAVVDPARVAHGLTAIVTVEFARHGTVHRQDFLARVRIEPTVTQCYMVTGDVSCVLIAHMRDMDDYLALADRLFERDDNVQAFYTHIVMQTIKHEPGILM